MILCHPFLLQAALATTHRTANAVRAPAQAPAARGLLAAVPVSADGTPLTGAGSKTGGRRPDADHTSRRHLLRSAWAQVQRWFPHTLRDRLILLVIALALTAGGPVYLYLNHVLGSRLLADRSAALDASANAIASALSDNLQGRLGELAILAESALPQGTVPNLALLGTRLDRLQASRPFYSWLGFCDGRGRVAAASGRLLLGANVRNLPWFARGLQAPYLGNVHPALLLRDLLPAEPDNAPIRFVDLALPVRDPAGETIGVLAAHLNWRWAGDTIAHLLPATATGQGIEVFVLDRSGQILFPERLFGVPMARVDATPTAWPARAWLPWAGRGGRGTVPTTRFVTRSVALQDPLVTPDLAWRVVVRQPAVQALREVATLQQLALATVLGAGAAFLLVVWWSMGQISRPLENLVAYVGQIKTGANVLPLTLRTDSVEIRALSDAVSGMALNLLAREQALLASNQILEAEVRGRTDKLQRANAALEKLVERDALTGLYNRRAASARLHAEALRLQRFQTPYVVMMVDIDHFKTVNDRFGHAAGDTVLASVAATLQAALRELDFVARFGGEEFLLILPNTTRAGGLATAEKLRGAVRNLAWPGLDRLSVSIGLAEADSAQVDEEQAVREADAELYAAKRAGRDCVRARPVPV